MRAIERMMGGMGGGEGRGSKNKTLTNIRRLVNFVPLLRPFPDSLARCVLAALRSAYIYIYLYVVYCYYCIPLHECVPIYATRRM